MKINTKIMEYMENSTPPNPYYYINEEFKKLNEKVDKVINRINDEFNSRLYTVREASLHFKVSELTVRKKIQKGEIKAFKIGDSIRIKHSEIFNSLQEVKSIKYKRKA